MDSWLAINIIFWMCGSVVSIFNKDADGLFFALVASICSGIFYIYIYLRGGIKMNKDSAKEIKCECGYSYLVLITEKERPLLCPECGEWTISKFHKIDKKTIILTIKCCDKCPYFDTKGAYTPDSFENVLDWICLKSEDKKIAQLDTFDKKPKIPEWCPL